MAETRKRQNFEKMKGIDKWKEKKVPSKKEKQERQAVLTQKELNALKKVATKANKKKNETKDVLTALKKSTEKTSKKKLETKSELQRLKEEASLQAETLAKSESNEKKSDSVKESFKTASNDSWGNKPPEDSLHQLDSFEGSEQYGKFISMMETTVRPSDKILPEKYLAYCESSHFANPLAWWPLAVDLPITAWKIVWGLWWWLIKGGVDLARMWFWWTKYKPFWQDTKVRDII